MLRSLENSPIDHKLETELHVYGETHSIDSVRQPFLNSPYYESISALRPRFETVAWTQDDEKFTELQGPDVNPVEHGPYQARTVAIPMIDAQNNSDAQFRPTNEGAEHFVAYHVQHDDHEGVYAQKHHMNHDVPLTQKTTESEQEEHNLWLKINDELFTNSKTMAYYVEQFEFSKGFLRNFWNISERIGYVSTGIQALHLAEEEKSLSKNERENAYTMARLVIGRSLGVIESQRQNITYADQFVTNNEDMFSKVSKYFDFSRKDLYI